MRVRVTRSDHPEVLEVIASEHCMQRFRRRRKIRTPGVEAIAGELTRVFEQADFTRWTPAWVISEQRTDMWALADDLAFPLTPTSTPGGWLATTCLVRGRD